MLFRSFLRRQSHVVRLSHFEKKLGCCVRSASGSRGVARQNPTYRAEPAYPSPRGGGSYEDCWGSLSLPCRCAAVDPRLARVPRPAGPLLQLVFRLSGNTVCRRRVGSVDGSSLCMCLLVMCADIIQAEWRTARIAPLVRFCMSRLVSIFGRSGQCTL